MLNQPSPQKRSIHPSKVAPRAPKSTSNATQRPPNVVRQPLTSPSNPGKAPEPAESESTEELRQQIEGLLSLAQEAQMEYAAIISDAMDDHSELNKKDFEEIVALLGKTLTSIQEELPPQVPDSLRPFLRETMVIVNGILSDVANRCQEFVKKQQELAGNQFVGLFMGAVLATLALLVKLSVDCMKSL